MNYIISFFRPEVLFNLRPEPLAGLGLRILLGGFAALLAAAFFSGYVASQRIEDRHIARGVKRIRNIFITMGVIGFIYTFFAYEGAVFLSARLWPVVIILATIVWLFFPVKYIVREVPIIKSEITRRKEIEKYLPR